MRLRRALAPFGRLARWWSALDPAERVLYRSLALLSPGWGVVWAPLALIVPGTILALVFFGFSLRRST